MHFSDGGTLAPIVIAHFSYTGGPPSVADCETIAGNWGGQLGNHINAIYPTDWKVTEVECIDLTSPTSSTATATISIDGLSTSPASPAQAALLLHKTISRRYRGGHPRTYMPGPAQDQQLNRNTWLDTAASQIEGAWITAASALVADNP